MLSSHREIFVYIEGKHYPSLLAVNIKLYYQLSFISNRNGILFSICPSPVDHTSTDSEIGQSTVILLIDSHNRAWEDVVKGATTGQSTNYVLN